MRGTRDYLRFLNIALGSAAETRYLIDLAARLGYVAKHDRAGLVDGYTDVMKGLQCLLRSLDGPKPKAQSL